MKKGYMRLVIMRCQSRDLGLRLAQVRVFCGKPRVTAEDVVEERGCLPSPNFSIYVSCLLPRSSIIILRLDLVSKEKVKRVYLGTRSLEGVMGFWIHTVFLKLPQLAMLGKLVVWFPQVQGVLL